MKTLLDYTISEEPYRKLSLTKDDIEVIQNWLIDHFCPEIQNWLTEQFSPQVQNYIDEHMLKQPNQKINVFNNKNYYWWI